jgi:hypothetical protein
MNKTARKLVVAGVALNVLGLLVSYVLDQSWSSPGLRLVDSIGVGSFVSVTLGIVLSIGGGFIWARHSPPTDAFGWGVMLVGASVAIPLLTPSPTVHSWEILLLVLPFQGLVIGALLLLFAMIGSTNTPDGTSNRI